VKYGREEEARFTTGARRFGRRARRRRRRREEEEGEGGEELKGEGPRWHLSSPSSHTASWSSD